MVEKIPDARGIASGKADAGMSYGGQNSLRAPVTPAPPADTAPAPAVAAPPQDKTITPAAPAPSAGPADLAAPAIAAPPQDKTITPAAPAPSAGQADLAAPASPADIVSAPAERAAQTLANASSQTASPPASGMEPPTFSWGGYFQAVGLLFLLLAALWMMVYLVRKFGKFRFMPSTGDFPRDGLRLEAQLPLGPRKGLMVVRFLNKRLLLGVTDQHITMITEGTLNNADDSRKFEDFIKAAGSRDSDG